MMRAVRRVLRRNVPYAMRWRFRAALRALGDVHTTFASSYGPPQDFPVVIARYERALRCYPGQDTLFEAKRRNMELSLASLDGIVVRPGETLSFWRCVGRTTTTRGYAPAAALKHGVLTQDVGGSICLASTLLFNVGLLAGAAIRERRCHSVDSYGDERYFELGRDAAVEYAYIDLRFENLLDVPLRIGTWIEGERVIAEAACARPPDLKVSITVGPICRSSEHGAGRLTVCSARLVEIDGATVIDETWESSHVEGAIAASALV